MSHWTPTVGVADALISWHEKERQRESAYVMPDLEPFRDSTGQFITGRREWREHLKRTGGVELSIGDMQRATERHARAKAQRAARFAAQPKVEAPAERAQPVRNTLYPKVAERLYNRPAPDRRTLIGIAIEEAKRRRK